MKTYGLFFILILVALAAPDASAQNVKQQKLIEGNSRPAIEKMLSDEKYLEKMGLLPTNEYKIASIKKNIARMIVSLEKAFPNGIYGFLGRDMDLIADATEAFYHSIDQHDRVARVRFSTPTLADAELEMVGKYLAQLGLDTAKYVHEARPFVIVDYTSYSSNPSQSRFIVRSAIRYLEDKGISPDEIPNRIAIATLNTSVERDGITAIYPLRRKYMPKTSPRHVAENHDLDTVVVLHAGEGSMAYSSEWHDKYGKMKENSKGEIETKPLSRFGVKAKRTVYQNMVEVVNLMTSKKMKSEIFNLAYEHDVTFEAKPEVDITEIEASFKKDIKSLIRGLKKLTANHKDNYTEKFKAASVKMNLTPNGAEASAMLTKEEYRALEHYLEISLEVLIQLYNADKIGVHDLHRIFSYVLTLREIETKDIFKVVSVNYRDVLPLEIMFGRASEREKYSELEGYGSENYKLILEKVKIPLSCSFLF